MTIAVYFNSRIAPRLWKDESFALELEEAGRRFRQWTYLPILPRRDDTLRACIREGIAQGLWAVVIGDNSTSKYSQLVDKPEQLDALQTLFDGSASLVKGDLLELIRQELTRGQPATAKEPDVGVAHSGEEDGRRKGTGTPTIPPPARRHARVRIELRQLPITKTSNLQPYLFKVLQEQDAGSEITLHIEVASQAGVAEEALEKRIVEGLEQLGIQVSWETDR